MNIQHICVHHVSLSAIEDTTIYFFLGGGGEALIERFCFGKILFIKKTENFSLIDVFS